MFLGVVRWGFFVPKEGFGEGGFGKGDGNGNGNGAVARWCLGTARRSCTVRRGGVCVRAVNDGSFLIIPEKGG